MAGCVSCCACTSGLLGTASSDGWRLGPDMPACKAGCKRGPASWMVSATVPVWIVIVRLVGGAAGGATAATCASSVSIAMTSPAGKIMCPQFQLNTCSTRIHHYQLANTCLSLDPGAPARLAELERPVIGHTHLLASFSHANTIKRGCHIPSNKSP